MLLVNTFCYSFIPSRAVTHWVLVSRETERWISGAGNQKIDLLTIHHKTLTEKMQKQQKIFLWKETVSDAFLSMSWNDIKKFKFVME